MLRTIAEKKSFRVFFYALVAGIVIFLPFVIYDHGYFLYYGDFNVQQIPFYRLAHDAVRSGNVRWNWNTDLGVNFVGSYSFYLLFSPFFWLTLPFPSGAVPYLMAPLLVLKTACAALTAYLYLRRFVKEENSAVIGSLLYAFSGWMFFNVFFNHFHEAAVFFPLLLLGLEKLVTENKRGLFAAAVLVNAAVNYWFFAGEAVFVVLYVIIRATDKSWGLSLRRFGLAVLEAVLGFAGAAAVVLPSVLALMGNPRIGSGEMLTGWNVWLYWHEQRQPAILHSLLFPPEAPARPNFLPDHGAKWASLSAWLPLFSVTGVLAYFFRRKDDWLKKMLALCLLLSMVPLFNSLFILLNDSYYARWFYMPVLLMALATVRALEDSVSSTADFARAVKWTGIALAGYIVMCGLTPVYWEEDELSFGLADDPERMWIYAAIAMVCLAAVAVLVLRLRYSRRFQAYALSGLLAVSAGFGIYYLGTGKHIRSQDEWLIEHAVHGSENISLPDEDFYRVDVLDSTDNIAMYWGIPTIQAFHSIVPSSIMEFYPAVGVTRDVGSRPEAEYYALRPLLSVKYLFIEESKKDQNPMSGYEYYDTQNSFHIYENENYLPMGFSYDEFVIPRLLEDVSTGKRGNLMLRAVVIEEDAIDRLGDLIIPLDEGGYVGFDEDTMAIDVENRRRHTADSFSVDNRGFTVTTSFDTPRLLFLSVPYDEGWTAYAMQGAERGDEVRIEKANVGFMAVRVPAGPAAVRFEYRTPGLAAGGLVSAAAILLLLLYAIRTRPRRGAPPLPEEVRQALLEGRPVNLTWEQYQAVYRDKAVRRARMQQVLNEAAVKHIDGDLPHEDQTLEFHPGGTGGEPEGNGCNPADPGNPNGERSGEGDGETLPPPG